MRRAGFAGLGLLALATPLAIVGLVCCWLLVSAEMPGRTWVRRALFGLVSTYAVIAGALTVLAVVHRPCHPRVLVAVLLVAAVAWRSKSPRREAAILADVSDRWSLGFGALTFGVLFAPFVGASTGQTMALLSQTTDGATHVHLVAAVARSHGYVQLLHPRGLSPQADQYPTGWHGNVWVVSDLLLGNRPSTAALVRLVGFLAVAGYGLMVTLAARIALRLASPHGDVSARSSLVGLACLGLSTLGGFGIFLMQLGSYTQVFAICSLLSLVLLADAVDAPGRVFVVLGASTIAVSQSWYLLLPLLAGGALVLLAQHRPPPRWWLPAAAAVGPLTLYPVLTGPSGTHVDEAGATLLPTIIGVLGLLVATGAGATAVTTRRISAPGRVLVAMTALSLLTGAGLAMRQGFIPGTGVSYYGAKVLLVTFLLGAILAAATTAAWIESGARDLRVLAGLGLVGVALGTYSTAWDAMPPRTARYEGHLDPVTLDAVFADHPRDRPAGTEVWIVDGCDRVGDLVATKWLYDVSLSWNDELKDDLNDYADEHRGSTGTLLRRLADPHLRVMELYLHRECDPVALTTLSRNPKVRVIRVP